MNEYDFVHPHWLSGRPLPAKKPIPTKGTLTKYFGSKWFNNSKAILNRIFDLWDPNFDQENFLVRFKDYTDQLLETYLATQKCPLKIPKSLVDHVDSFEILNHQFSKYVSSISNDLPSDSKALIDQTNALINESNFFIYQFNTAVDLIWLGREFPFKPTDRLRKHAFLKALIAWSENNKDENYPNHNVLIQSKELRKFSIPDRTYRLWKEQLDQGTFHYFVQPRKKRQLVLAKLNHA